MTIKWSESDCFELNETEYEELRMAEEFIKQ